MRGDRLPDRLANSRDDDSSTAKAGDNIRRHGQRDATARLPVWPRSDQARGCGPERVPLSGKPSFDRVA